MEIDRKKKELFEEMPVRKALMTMAAPTIASQLINLLYNVVDTIYIGQVGNAYMTAAVAIGYVIFMLTIAISNLLGVGGGTMFSRLSGKGDNEKAGAVCVFSFYSAIVCAFLFSLFVFVFMNPLLYKLGASVNTIKYARQYVFFVIVLGGIPTILSSVGAHLLRNAGYSKQAGVGLSGGGFLNIILDPIFMFFLLPDGLEMVGAAMATLIANIISCVYMVITLHKTSKISLISLDIRKLKLLKRRDVMEVFSIGIPSALLPGLFDLANMTLNSLVAEYGDFQLAALGIVLKAERLSTAISMGISQGMLPIVAYNFASGRHKRMNEVIKMSRIYGGLVSVATITLYLSFAPQICSIFLNTAGPDAEGLTKTLLYATVFLRIRCLAAPMQMLNFNTSYCMQAVGYARGAMIHTVVRIMVFYIPCMYFLNDLYAENGIIYSFPIAETISAVFVVRLFAGWRKNYKDRIGEIGIER